jgi:hypothetical protein
MSTDQVINGMADELRQALQMRNIDINSHPDPAEVTPPVGSMFMEYKKRGGNNDDPDAVALDLINAVKEG